MASCIFILRKDSAATGRPLNSLPHHVRVRLQMLNALCRPQPERYKLSLTRSVECKLNDLRPVELQTLISDQV